MIDDIACHNDRAVFWGLYVYIGFVILYMVLFCWCALAPRFGCAGRNGGSCSAGPMSGKAKPIIPGQSQGPWA